MRIIRSDNEAYMVITSCELPQNETLPDRIAQIRESYSLCDSVLRLGAEYFFCSKLIEAEFEDLKNKENIKGKNNGKSTN